MFLENDPVNYKLNHEATALEDCIPQGVSADDSLALHALLTSCAEISHYKNAVVPFILGSISDVELDSPSKLAEHLLLTMPNDHLGAMVMGMVMTSAGEMPEGAIEMIEEMESNGASKEEITQAIKML